LEPVSPELVLVDPELAQAERARLASRDNVSGLVGDRAVSTAARPAPVFRRAQAIAPTRPLEEDAEIRIYEEPAPPAAVGGGRRRFRNALLTVSLMANAVLISVVVAGSRENQPVSAFPATLSKGRETSAHTTTAAKTPRSSSPTKRVKRQRRRAPKTVGEVERMILTAVAESPKGKLPPSLINPATGLAKNNLQSVCHASIGASFSCLIRPARHRPTEGLYVRYRPASSGRWTLKWYPYRHG
jgi:hypothetical protein